MSRRTERQRERQEIERNERQRGKKKGEKILKIVSIIFLNLSKRRRRRKEGRRAKKKIEKKLDYQRRARYRFFIDAIIYSLICSRVVPSNGRGGEGADKIPATAIRDTTRNYRVKVEEKRRRGREGGGRGSLLLALHGYACASERISGEFSTERREGKKREGKGVEVFVGTRATCRFSIPLKRSFTLTSDS